MASIIPGFEYDIFISYRQKDNKYDGWVTEFAENLKGELESAFKEDISLYFDINPHDGLLETHDVNASLKEKLKCLVFIPVVSRTYCDPRSFAWEHEFKAFINQASADEFGLKVKLPDGNVAGRILPVLIHELDPDDKTLIESELGGFIRGIEFIYKEPGVNRPLRPNDDEKINLNKTKYRNQINKTGNAIKGIITGLQKGTAIPLKKNAAATGQYKEANNKEKAEEKGMPGRLNKKKLALWTIALSVCLIAALLIYPRIFKKNGLERLRSTGERVSVAVMPFQNMTNDTVWNVWQNGIQDILVTYLSNSPEELKVRQTESINDLIQRNGLTDYALITPAVASNISNKLDASVFISGSIKKAGSVIRLNAQLTDSKTKEIFKSFEIDGAAQEDKIFQITDSLKRMVRNFLLISKLEKELSPEFKQLAFTGSPEAYKFFIYGENARKKSAHATAVKMYSQAISIDSTFVFASVMLSVEMYNLNLFEEGKKLCLNVYQKRDRMTIQQKIWTNRLYSMYFETPAEEIQYLRQLLEIDDQMPFTYYAIGFAYNKLYEYDKAIPEFEKALEIYKKWDLKPYWVSNYFQLGIAYHNTGNYKKEKLLYRRAEQDFPDLPYLTYLIYRQAILAMVEGKTDDAKEYINKYVPMLKKISRTESQIAYSVGNIYLEADVPDTAETYFRKALSLDPGSTQLMNDLAWVLNETNKSAEGIDLIDKALKLVPDDYVLYGTKGELLYRQGKYREALEALEKCWELKPIYSHDIYIDLQQTKKALAGEK